MTVAWPVRTVPTPLPHDVCDAAIWLISRHPQLAELASRVPGVVTITEPFSRPHLDVEQLQRDVRSYDANGPSALVKMTRREQTRLRLLATLSLGLGVNLSITRLIGFRLDAADQALLEDWFVAVRTQVQP
jgi:hypothetical protein